MQVKKVDDVISAKPNMLTFAAIGDLHIREDRTSLFRELFAEVSTKADVLVLCGDLTDVGRPREAEVLVEDLRACSIPIVGVLGNHDYESDRVEEVKNILKSAGVHLLNGQSYEINGVAFVGVKGFIGGFGRRMLASFGEAVVKALVSEAVSEAMRLENSMRAVKSERAVVVLPFPIPSKESRWRSSRFWAHRVSAKPSTVSKSALWFTATPITAAMRAARRAARLSTM
jgi:uncharacterized protein